VPIPYVLEVVHPPGDANDTMTSQDTPGQDAGCRTGATASSTADTVVLLICHIDGDPAVHFLTVKERKERRGNREFIRFIPEIIEPGEDVGA
jgi:hypothetical protein